MLVTSSLTVGQNNLKPGKFFSGKFFQVFLTFSTASEEEKKVWPICGAK
jgi:hypothetical protein